jgi:hypothetical protein
MFLALILESKRHAKVFKNLSLGASMTIGPLNTSLTGKVEPQLTLRELLRRLFAAAPALPLAVVASRVDPGNAGIEELAAPSTKPDSTQAGRVLCQLDPKNPLSDVSRERPLGKQVRRQGMRLHPAIGARASAFRTKSPIRLTRTGASDFGTPWPMPGTMKSSAPGMLSAASFATAGGNSGSLSP